jgi:hypothetical protein
MRPATGDGNGGDAPKVAANTIVQMLIPMVAKSDRQILVVDGDDVVGLVDREAVMAALVEER